MQNAFVDPKVELHKKGPRWGVEYILEHQLQHRITVLDKVVQHGQNLSAALLANVMEQNHGG